VDVDSAAAAAKALGARVRIRGIARDSKLPSVQAGDLVVHCAGRERWPAELVNKPVVVTGTLEFTHELDARVSPTGEISQGVEGGLYLLRDCQREPG
jgi:hypothetical protein